MLLESTVKLFNTALSGDEVQDLGAGGSVPYIYKGASQTDFASGWSFSSGWAIYTGTINDADTFNQNISDWNVNNVMNMQRMFYNSIQFDQNFYTRYRL